MVGVILIVVDFMRWVIGFLGLEVVGGIGEDGGGGGELVNG